MASSALKSALRFTACGRAVNLKSKLRSTLERAPSTINREMRRNARPTKVWRGGYYPARAQRLAERRRRQDGRFKLARQPDLRDCVGKSLAMGHSPEQIAGRLALEHGHIIISHESNLPFHLSSSAQKDYWHRLLPRRKLRRGRRGRRGGSPASFIKQRRSITERPAEVEGRETSGHWEADFMLFARYGQGLLVPHERQTRFTIVDHPLDRKADRTARRLARQLGRLPQPLRKTISFDNGTEFALEYHRLDERHWCADLLLRSP